MDWFQSLFTNTGSVAHIVVLYCLVIAVGDIRINQTASKEEIFQALDFYREC